VVSRMLDNIHGVELTNGVVPDLTRKRPAAHPAAPVVQTTRMHELAVMTALELAGGDSRRLLFMADGTVMVTNRPRQASRTQEGSR
jgi:hypothetical protein